MVSVWALLCSPSANAPILTWVSCVSFVDVQRTAPRMACATSSLVSASVLKTSREMHAHTRSAQPSVTSAANVFVESANASSHSRVLRVSLPIAQ